MKLNSHKSVGSDVHLRVLRELADVVVVFGSYGNQVIPSVTGKRETLLPFLKREERMNYEITDQCASPLSGMIMEQILLEDVLRQVKDKEGSQGSHHGFTMGKLCLSNMAFCDGVTATVDRGTPTNVII